jgi:flagellar hook protein FlgE
MLRSLNSGVSGIQQMQERLDVIGNNIANVNTTGFKGGRVDFEDAFSQTLSAGVGGDPMQVGTGVGTSAINNEFTQGAVTRTGNINDLAVSGAGFFQVRDNVNNQNFVTRDGTFHVDTAGYLVTDAGMRVQGFSDPGLSVRGDIQIDNAGAPGGSTSPISSYAVDNQGMIRVRLVDGTEYVRGQVLLQTFANPQALTKEGQNLYSVGASAGALPQISAPETNGLGTIESGALELSNVDLANEFADLITTQRAFQANARIITTSDEILQELVNLKR